ncbi:MAG: peroxidase family protein, partial [Pseudomonadota bacterium]
MKHLIPVSILFAFGLAACGNGGDDFINAAPIVSAGTAQTVTEGAIVELSGTASDPNGDAITVQWSQESGPDIELNNSTSLEASFLAPNVNESVDIVLRLTVTDARGTSASQTMTVSIEDTARDGPSPQGIPDDGESRRDRARNNRNNNRPRVNNREVRTYDGSNNNIDNPSWGATFEHLQRLADVDYADGISTLAGPDRPSARAVSNGVVDQAEGTSLPNAVNGTDFIWQWGQF